MVFYYLCGIITHEDLIFLVACFFSSIYIQSYYSCSNGNYRVCLCGDDRTAKTKKKSDFIPCEQIMKPTFILCKDRIEYTKEMTTEDKAQLFDAILLYNNDQPIWELSYVVKVVFSKMKNFFDEQNQKYEEKIIKRNKENGAKGGRPPNKKPKKPSGLKWNPSKPKETLTETDTDTSNSLSNERENNSNELLDSSNNSLFILKYNTQTWQIEKTETNIVLYGNMDWDVEKVLAMIKGNNDWALDWSIKSNRNDAKNLAKKLQKLPAVEEWKTSWEMVLAMILWVMKDDKYYWSKLSSPKEIYDNFGKLVTQSRIKIQEMQQKQRKKSKWVF